jgi:acetolactate decarboxylase
VKHFQADRAVRISDPVDFARLTALLDQALPTLNIPYAIRIDGRFTSILVRSVPRQSRPYPTLAQAIEQQRTFTLRDVSGTLVGFRMPAYMQGLNVVGYHFHFLTADRTTGGHVLALEMQDVTVELDEARAFSMALPEVPDFDDAALGP